MYGLILVAMLMAFMLAPLTLFLALVWLASLRRTGHALPRRVNYAVGLLFWSYGLLLGWIVYPVVNDLAWQTGHGDALVQRPWAAVHHRLLGLHDWVKDVNDPVDQLETREKRAQTPAMLLKVGAVVGGSYLGVILVPAEITRAGRRLMRQRAGATEPI